MAWNRLLIRRSWTSWDTKTNRAAFRMIADLVPLTELAGTTESAASAVLFGAAGLLPDPSHDAVLAEQRTRVQQMWSAWWPHRKAYQPVAWNRHRLRPYNSPERRLMAAHFVLRENGYVIGRKIIDAGRHGEEPGRSLRRLAALFTVESDPAWNRFYDFRSNLKRPARLLGRSRIHDLIINLGIPLFFAHCLLKNDAGRCDGGKHTLLRVPMLQDNRLFKEAVHHFFMPPSRATDVVPNACAQQGLLRLYQHFHLDL